MAAGFASRVEAGRLLGAELVARGETADVVVGLARGGVVVAAEVARALGRPLDALAVRKVGHPLQEEYAIGAVTPGEGGVYVRSRDGLGEREVEAAVERAKLAADELDARLHRAYAPIPVGGRRVLLVDDGLATGATMTAAVRWARSAGASGVVVAVPVAAEPTVRGLRGQADDVVALLVPDPLWSVGSWYDDFSQVTSDEVEALLGRS